MSNMTVFRFRRVAFAGVLVASTGMLVSGLSADAQGLDSPPSLAVASEGVLTPSALDDASVVTLPDSAHEDTGGVSTDEELAALAKATGDSVETVRAVLEVQAKVHGVVDQLRGSEWFVDFMFSADGMSGLLLSEPGTQPTAQEALTSLAGVVEVREAALDESERKLAVATATAMAQKSLKDSYLATSYDPFRNVVKVWTKYAARVESGIAERLISDFAISAALPNTTIELDSSGGGVPARGGQYADHRFSSEWCTTSFGVWTGTQSAYLMAGHCGNPTPEFSINGNVATSYTHRKFVDYQDRQVLIAPGASYFVRISPTAEVDMSTSTSWHIAVNDRLCRFGQTSYNLSCSTISSVNAPVTHWNGAVVWASVSATSTCAGGDSGGPVWFYTTPERLPAGLISGGTISGNKCMFVSIDDQFAGLSLWML